MIYSIVALIGFSAKMGCFEVAGERYTERLRAMVFRAFLKQEIGYFDEEDNSVGALTTRLALDSKNVNELVTKVAGDVVEIIATAITGKTCYRIKKH